jgi:hypothetical protein
MPLTEKGQKIKGAMEKQYGPEKGEQVFYASKNKGKITGVDTVTISNSSWKAEVELPREKRSDDNQHMGFTGAGVEPIKKLVSECDALSKRLDAFEGRQHQRKPEKVKPRTKDFMQPSNPHPKEPGK